MEEKKKESRPPRPRPRIEDLYDGKRGIVTKVFTVAFLATMDDGEERCYCKHDPRFQVVRD